jgi:hypothetical protein
MCYLKRYLSIFNRTSLSTVGGSRILSPSKVVLVVDGMKTPESLWFVIHGMGTEFPLVFLILSL